MSVMLLGVGIRGSVDLNRK